MMEQEANKKKIWIIGMSCLLVLVLLIGASYAWFTLTLNGTKSNVIKAGTLSLILNDENSVGINSEQAVPMLDEVGKTGDPYHFTLENNGELPSDYTIYLDDMDLEEGETRMQDKFIKYNLIKNGNQTTSFLKNRGTNPNRVLDSGTINQNQTITYDLRLWIDQDATNEVMGTTFRGKLRVIATQEMAKNENIVAVYTYDTATCQTGEEASCVEIGKQATYNSGTIVKYKVNDTEEKYFHVLFDEGDTLIMQQRENTIDTLVNWHQIEQTAQSTSNKNSINRNNTIKLNQIAENSKSNRTMFLAGSYKGPNNQGPLAVLSELESLTEGWTNVNDQTYTMGTTLFKKNSFTGCDIETLQCTTNTYTLSERIAKARMITAQEAIELGCSSTINSCPTWMRQSLNNDSSNAENSIAYWTMSANTNSTHNGGAVNIQNAGSLFVGPTIDYRAKSGARAVIVIDK